MWPYNNLEAYAFDFWDQVEKIDSEATRSVRDAQTVTMSAQAREKGIRPDVGRNAPERIND